MNTIIVSYDIYNQAISKHEKIQPFENFIFPEFKLVLDGVFQGHKVWYEVKWEKDKYTLFDVAIFGDGNKGVNYKCLYDPSADSLAISNDSKFSKNEIEIIKISTTIILFYMGYIMTYPRKHKKERVSSHRYSREHRLSTRQNKIYLFDDIVKYVSENYIPEGSHHNIQNPCWEVRGHYRHYKSGKTVFVKSYRKGKQRDKIEPKSKEYYT